MPAFRRSSSTWRPVRATGALAIACVLGSASVYGCGSGEIGAPPFLGASPIGADAQEPTTPEPGVDAQACGAGEATIYYRDSDSDGFGDSLMTATGCAPIVGFAARGGDCDDTEAQMNPDATEVCGDTMDNDCDGDEPCMASAVAHWAFADGEGSTAADSPASAHPGTLRNGPTWTDIALEFDGEDDFVEVPHSDAFLLDTGTVALWFRADTVGVDGGLWSKDSNGFDTGGHLSISVQSADTNVTYPRIQARIQNTTKSITIESESVSAATWYHVAVTFGPGGFELWLSGELANVDAYAGGMGTSSGGAGNFQPIVIGALSINSGDLTATPITAPFDGEIGDVRIYDRALTASEILDLAQQTTP